MWSSLSWKFWDKLHSDSQLERFKQILQFFFRHDCAEAKRLTHSCFKGRSDFTTTDGSVFDTEADRLQLCEAIAWLYERRIPVVLMERQTSIFPIIFDIDLKCTREETLAAVPGRSPH